MKFFNDRRHGVFNPDDTGKLDAYFLKKKLFNTLKSFHLIMKIRWFRRMQGLES
jgi:hypothetical protein